MSTYGEVKTDFNALLNRRDCTSAQTIAFLQNSLARIQRNLRIPAMERAISTTPTDAGLAIPADYLQIIRLSDVDGHELVSRDLTTVMKLITTSGVPLVYARRGSRFMVGPVPTDDVRLDYYAQFDDLVADADENLITLIAPDFLIYGALCYAGIHFNDKRLPGWQQTYVDIAQGLQDQADRDELLNAVVSPAYPYPQEDY